MEYLEKRRSRHLTQISIDGGVMDLGNRYALNEIDGVENAFRLCFGIEKPKEETE